MLEFSQTIKTSFKMLYSKVLKTLFPEFFCVVEGVAVVETVL